MSRLIGSLLSLMPEKERKLSRRLMSLRLKRELFGIGTLAMLARAHAEENGSHTPPHRPAVFLTHASPASHIAADSELITQHLSGHVEIVGCVTISTDFFVAFPASIKNIKERDPVQRDFLGKKVKSSVRI